MKERNIYQPVMSLDHPHPSVDDESGSASERNTSAVVNSETESLHSLTLSSSANTPTSSSERSSSQAESSSVPPPGEDEDPSLVPSAAPTDGGDGECDSQEIDDETMQDLGFFFEGARATTPQTLSWKCGKRKLHVVVHSIDEEPGAVQSGHYLWPAAQLLVDYLIQQQADTTTSPTSPPPLSPSTEGSNPDNNGTMIGSMVELGAGCALASLVALQLYRESLQVAVCTDHDPGTCERARDNYENTLSHILDRSDTTDDELNAAINSLAPIPVRFEPLEWGSNGTDLATVQRHLREHTVQESTVCDLVLGSDLIYCAAVVEPLLATASQLMHPLNGRFLLSQSFAYDDDAERAIDAACHTWRLTRHILWQDGPDRRVQEFRRSP